MTIKLPFIYRNRGFSKNKKGFFLNEDKLKDFLLISDESARRIAKIFNEDKFKCKVRLFKPKIKRSSLAKIYKQLIDEGIFNNKAELANGLGVSRTWITKVMNELKNNPTE